MPGQGTKILICCPGETKPPQVGEPGRPNKEPAQPKATTDSGPALC